MYGPVITVDVSKGTCHIQPYYEQGKPMHRPKVLKNTIEDFTKLQQTIDKLKEKSGTDVPVIFEATGVYHRCLQKYLEDHEITYYIITPLLSAAYRKTDINGNKSDDLDCAHISKAYYSEHDLKPHFKQKDVFEQLRALNRLYESELNHLRMRKTKFRGYLDIIFPLLDKCFKGKASLYDPVCMELLKKYHHPQLLLKHKEETVVRYLERKTNHNTAFIANIVSKIFECAKQCYSGCEPSDIEALSIPMMIEEIQEQEERCNTLLSQMIELASTLPYFNCVKSIVGIGENLAARIIAEIGDINRFTNRRAITAYAGLNPKIRQSGDIDGTHLAISKKGNRHLRCLLYLGTSCNYRLKKKDPLYLFNQKKRQQSQSPLKPKAATIATAHKLLIIIYALCRNGELYHS